MSVGDSGRRRLRWFEPSRFRSELADADRFYQQRVVLYVKVLFGFFALCTVGGAAKWFLVSPELMSEYQREWVVGLSVFTFVTLGMGADWWYLARRQRSVVIVGLYESLGTVLGAVFVSSLVTLAPHMINVFSVFLSVLLMLVSRAALVPSSGTRTLTVGLLSTAACTGGTWWWTQAQSPTHPLDAYLWAVPMVWGVIFSVSTAAVSRVIYGLRRTAQQMMQLGNYTLDELLGEGGMGAVYRARHVLLKRPSALKLLPPEKAGEAAVARFEREVQDTSALTHPNIVEIYDFGRTPDGIFYYVMEYLDGLDLAEAVQLYGPMPAGRVIYLARQIVHALAHAHAQGLVHRDVKPANVVMSDRGGRGDWVTVLDFGLVKHLDDPDAVGLTAHNAITGTPLYLAPEAIRSPETIDGRADLYALCAVMYFLLTGTHVFSGENVIDVCSHHLHTEPEPPNTRAGSVVCQPDLEAVVLKGLAKDPNDRFVDGLALYRALTACAERETWSGEHARTWWDGEHEAVSEYRHAQQRAIESGNAKTVAVEWEDRPCWASKKGARVAGEDPSAAS